MADIAGKSIAANERQVAARRIRQLLSSLGWITPLIVLVSLLAAGAGFYLLQARPLAHANVLAREEVAAEETKLRTESLIAHVERSLLTAQAWSREGVIGVNNPMAFNRLMIPLVDKWTISTVRLTNDEGRAVLLLKTADGWINRITDVPKYGKQQRWMYWKDADTPVREEWKTEDWDPRLRPWYLAAMGAPEMQIVWTDPYIQQINHVPVLTASVRWHDSQGHQWVISCSVDLVDLSRFTSQLCFGAHGQVALLTADDRLLGVPRHPSIDSEESIRKAVLREPGEVGLKVLDSALRLAAKKWGADPRQSLMQVVPPSEAGDGREWLASIMPLSARNQSFRVVALAPTADFVVIPVRLTIVLTGVMLAICLLAALAARLTVNAIRRPMTGLFSSIEENRRQAEKLVERRTTVAAITARMQQAQNPDELAYSLLCELAPRLDLGQALFCLWDESAGRLSVAASYAGAGEGVKNMPPAGESLLSQCARDRKAILLRNPGEEYLRVRSGLGDAAPAMVVISPVQYGGRLFAVVEMASLRDFTEDDRMFLADLEPIVAMNLDILLRAERTADLLAQTAADDERNRLILGAVADGIWGMDNEGCTTFVNRMALEMLGYAEDEVVGKGMHALVHSRYADGRAFPLAECPMSLTLSDGVPRTVDDEVLWHKDGRAVHVEYSTTAIHRQNEIVGVVVVFRDVGVRKAAEQTMKEDEAILWQIIEDSPSAAAIGTEEGLLLRCNRRLSEVLGVEPEYFESHLMTEFWSRPEERAVFVERLKASGLIRDYETVFRRGDGAAIRVELNSRWVLRGGRRVMLTWLTDVTRLREAEETLLRAVRKPAETMPDGEMDRLAALLADSDAAAVEFWNGRADRLRVQLGEGAEAIERAIRDFDFETAARCLAAARETHAAGGGA